MKPLVHLAVCRTCRGTDIEDVGPRPGERLARAVAAEVSARGLDDVVAVSAIDCLSVCKRPCSATVSAPEKFAYVIGDLDPEAGAADLVAFALAHAASVDGIPPWRDRPQAVRKGTVARVPPPGHEAAPVAPVFEKSETDSSD